MGNTKRPDCVLISRERLRRIPSTGFGWIDRRFVRDGFLLRLSNQATLLYFFLVTVANPDGLSYFGEATISGLLRLETGTFKAARAELEAAGLILFCHPLYQVLALPQRPAAP